jgi:hypothetical protein
MPPLAAVAVAVTVAAVVMMMITMMITLMIVYTRKQLRRNGCHKKALFEHAATEKSRTAAPFYGRTDR